jgi:cell division protein FtsB
MCALRAELRDVKAERDSAVAQQAQHYADLLTAEQRIDALRAEVARLRGEPADPISGRDLLAALDHVSDETLDAIEDGVRS